MSAELGKMTERRLWLGVFMLAIVMTVGLLLIAFGVSEAFSLGGQVSNLALTALLVALALSLLSSGILAFLRIIDWFEARRTRRDLR